MSHKGIGLKRRRKEYVDKREQDYTYTYESKKAAPSVLKKTRGYDTSLQSSKQEKRGRKKAGSTGKITEHQNSEKYKVRSRRSGKQSKAKKGGK